MGFEFEYPFYVYILITIGGFAAGVINTLAGSGSLITLPILIWLGLPANVANATNRIGIFFQGAVAIPTMQKRGGFSYKPAWWIIVATAIGAVIGARVAADIDERGMEMAIGILMVMMLFVILLNPKRWLRETNLDPNAWRKPHYWLVFIALGLYGGFIQAGIGIFMLAALVLMAGYDLVWANAIKLVAVFLYTIPVIIVFLADGLINWEYGILLSIGQMAGAWWAARFATGHPQAQIWIRRLLIAVVLAAAIKFLIPQTWIDQLLSV